MAADRAAFALHVREALGHLHDLPFLARHSLAALTPAGTAARGAAVRQLLMEAIDALKPPAAAPADTPAWRQHRLLRLRYVEGAPAHRAADALALSERQARRVQHEALEAVTAVLWERLSAPARGAPGDTPAAPEPAGTTDVAAAVDGVARTLQPLLTERGARLEAALPADLPRVLVARVALRQALFALLVEGLDLGWSQIQLTATAVPGAIRLAIRGRGDSVERLRSSPPVARDLLSAGSPAAAEGVAILVRAPPAGDAVEFVLPTARLTVLLVDDDPDFIRLFRRCLVGSPYTLVSAGRMEDALDCIRGNPPDIIVLDVVLPAFDGWEFLQRLKAEAPTAGIPVVICSVLQEASLARALGAAACLAKPVNPRALLAALERCRPTAARATDRVTLPGSA